MYVNQKDKYEYMIVNATHQPVIVIQRKDNNAVSLTPDNAKLVVSRATQSKYRQ